MKVVAFNGSPKKAGNTYQALKLVCEQLEKENIDTEIIHVGNQDIKGCMGCGRCFRNKDEKCIQPGEVVNDAVWKMKNADGILLGSPVHYAGMAGTFKSFLDRTFYVAGANGGLLRHKVGASVAAVRRSGGIPTFEQMNIYLLYSQMFIATANYWNVIHGQMPGQIHEDAEGIQIMQVLGDNMAYLLKMIEKGREVVPAPENPKKIMTNFVR